jgi:hypothetical protein
MNRRLRCLLFVLPVSVSLLMATVLVGAGCELAVDIAPTIDGSVSDVLDCGICADVSADAVYGAVDVTISNDTGSDLDAGTKDATTGRRD